MCNITNYWNQDPFIHDLKKKRIWRELGTQIKVSYVQNNLKKKVEPVQLCKRYMYLKCYVKKAIFAL